MKGIHLCAVRLQLLRLNTMPAMDCAPVRGCRHAARTLRDGSCARLGRLPVPMVRSQGRQGLPRRLLGRSHRTSLPLPARSRSQAPGLVYDLARAHQRGLLCPPESRALPRHQSCRYQRPHLPCAQHRRLERHRGLCRHHLLLLRLDRRRPGRSGRHQPGQQPAGGHQVSALRQEGRNQGLRRQSLSEPGLDRYWVPSVTESALFGTKIADDSLPDPRRRRHRLFLRRAQTPDRERLDRPRVHRAPHGGWSETEAKVRSLSWETLERSSGTHPRRTCIRFAEAFGKARHAIIVWSMGITQHAYGSDNVRAIVNLQLAKGNIGREHTGLMPIRGHSGVQGGAEMGGQPSAYVMGFPVNEENAKKFAAPEMWGFEPPSWKGLTAAHMVLAAGRGEIDALWQSGGNFKSTLPEPELVDRALGKIKLRVHQDIVANPTMFVEPADTVVLLPSRTRYEQRGGGTETSTERRIIYSPEIPGPRPGDTRDEWEIPVMVARKLDPERAALIFPWRDTQDIRNEIDRVCPTYKGIANLRQEGRSVPVWRAAPAGGPLPDARRLGHFSVVALPEEPVPPGQFLVATRRGKQFNSMVLAEKDPLTGASRDDIIMSAEDAERLGLKNGDADHPAQRTRLVHRTRAHRPHQARLPAGALAGGQRDHSRRTARSQRRARLQRGRGGHRRKLPAGGERRKDAARSPPRLR